MAGRRLAFYMQANRQLANGTKYQVDGYFTVSEKTATDLGFAEKSQMPDVRIIERVAHDRIGYDAAGTPKTINVKAGYQYKAISLRGSKTVTVRTFDKIAGSKARNPNKAYHTISFRFPSWCSTIDISDALAEIIPEDKFAAIGAEGTQNQIERFFITKGGRRYPIMKAIAAEQRGQDETPTIDTTGVQVAESSTEANTLAEKVKKTYYKARNYLPGG